MTAEPGNFELDDIGTSLGGGENSELGPTWEGGAGQEGRLRVLETSTDTSWLRLLWWAVRTLPHASPYVQSREMTHLIYSISQVAPRSRVLLQIPELFDFLHLRGTGTTP